jgi:hypothetical protein
MPAWSPQFPQHTNLIFCSPSAGLGILRRPKQASEKGALVLQLEALAFRYIYPIHGPFERLPSEQAKESEYQQRANSFHFSLLQEL